MAMIPMTTEGEKLLQDELQKLKSVERPVVIQAIAEARAHGDLKENAEYHAAREKQSFLEGRINDIESKLSNAQIIDVTRIKNEGRIIFGSTVTLNDLNHSKELTYKIVGEDEADLTKNKISLKSPIARALIGKNKNDFVEVITPRGDVNEFEIKKVEYI
tara:strand:- start:5485 stop:5964 length:480 start_codon:yes stop_codon:yes gene_type:complete